MMKKALIVCLLFGLLFTKGMGVAFCQIETFSEVTAMDFLRVKQVSGKDSSNHLSYTIRSSSLFFHTVQPNRKFWQKKAGFEFRNIGFTQRQNDNLGLGHNDGSMLPAVGIQQRATVTLAARWKRLHLQLAPEWMTAENKDPLPFKIDASDPNYMARYYLSTVNKIDMYWRYGKDPINKILPGQSSLKYQTKSLAVGVSTESMWWGPSLRNGLVMSNNASNFPYLTLNSLAPLETKVGRFEGQVVYGNLTNPEFEHPDHERMKGIWLAGIAQKDTSKRSLAGFVISWEPKWTPNLFIGMAAAASAYRNKLDRAVVAFPFFTSRKPIKIGSVFLRYVMPQEKTELYFEFGRSDKMATPFNLVRDSIPLGYTAGVRKMMPLSGGKSHMFIGIELTRLELPDPRLVFMVNEPFGRPLTNSWYAGSQVLQGYTNYGQVMGSWIGPGSNSQTLQFGWVKGAKKITITGERVQHNNDFYYYNYITNDLRTQYQNPNKHWADINATGQIQWNVRNLLFSGSWSYTSLLNYRWIKLDGGFAGPSKVSDRKNTQIQVSAFWFFNKNMLK
jgi:hypothetical protein